MGSEWKEMRLGDVIELKRGYDLPKRNRKPGPVPLVSSSGITDFHAEAKVKGPGVVTGRYGTIGQVFYIEQDFWPLNTTLYVRDFKGNDPKFISYFLRTINYHAYSDKAAVPGVNRNHLHMAKVVVPVDVTEQRAIAHILGTLDDKIELNRRMNATLEAMARALFKSWFVDFDPVWENIKRHGPGHPLADQAAARPGAPSLPEEILALFPDGFEESALGLIPRGWEASKLGEVIEIFDSKRIPLNKRQRMKRRGPYPYYGAAGIMDYVDDYLFDGIYVLTGEDGSVVNESGYPIVQYVWGQFWVNNHAHVLQGKNGLSTEHLYLLLQSTNISAFVTGAVQPKLNQKNLKSIPMVLPSKAVARAFSDEVQPYFALVRDNTEQSRTLASLRDMLLPRLISGELRVGDAERFLAEVGV